MSENPVENSGAKNDPLAGLHRMSTTAGLGTGEYSAISGLAIAAVLIGAVSVMVGGASLVAWGTAGEPIPDIFLLFPLLAVLFGILGQRRIARSNGTLTGRNMALAGLSIGIVALVIGVAHRVADLRNNRADEARIAVLIGQLNQTVVGDKLPEAYGLFNERFKARVDQPIFIAVMQVVQKDPRFGQIRKLEWNGRVQFDSAERDGERKARAVALVAYEKNPEPDRVVIDVHKVDGRWWIENLPSVFPVEKPKTK